MVEKLSSCKSKQMHLITLHRSKSIIMVFFSSLGDLPNGKSKCPTIPLFSMLCLFLEFPVSVLHHPVHELLSSPSSSSLPFHLSFHPSFYYLPLYIESSLLECVQSSSSASFPLYQLKIFF